MYKKELFKKVDSALKEKSEIAYTNQLKKKIEVDREWGLERLIEIQTSEERSKMKRLRQLLELARSRFDDEKILLYSESMIRGLDKFIEYAEFRGFKKLNPSIWVVQHPHSKAQIILVQNADELPTACAMANKEKPSFYFTVRELLAVVPEDVFDIKKKFSEFGNVEIETRKPVKQKDIDAVALHDEII